MIAVRVVMKFGQAPLKRTPVVLQMDANDQPLGPVLTDRSGVAMFDAAPGSGKVLVSEWNASMVDWMVRFRSNSGRLHRHPMTPPGPQGSFPRVARPIRA